MLPSLRFIGVGSHCRAHPQGTRIHINGGRKRVVSSGKHVRANLGEELSVALRKHHDLQVPKHQAISAYERPCESGNQRQMTKSQSRRRRGYMRFSHLSAARL